MATKTNKKAATPATRKAKLTKRIATLETRIANATEQNKKRRTKIALYHARLKRLAAKA